MTKLILLRHGQSLANADHLFAGHSDFDLSEFGRAQAQMTASYLLKHERIDKIYASDLLRAYHTACPVGDAFGLPVVKDTGLREIYAGAWEGMSFSEIAESYPDAFSLWRNDYSHACPPKGESTAEVYRRVVPHICSLAQENDGKCVLLATHATVVRAFDSYARGLSEEETWQIPFYHNASINIYNYDNGKVSVIRSDIIDHLEGNTSALPPIINA
ncbi:MAG: histidine phosphatase family protein [Clostridia bacterium]|nr:histidine phosphatase family protein [Clostridia bacterium]